MPTSDLGLLIAERDGNAAVPEWMMEQARFVDTIWSWPRFGNRRRQLKVLCPLIHDWMASVFNRWQARRYTAYGLAFQAHVRFCPTVESAWKLADPPSPGVCLRGFMRPLFRERGWTRPSEVSSLDWAYWRLYIWGVSVDALAKTSGHRYARVRQALVNVIEALMRRLDYICWALNIDPRYMPEGGLSPGWYARHETWIRGQRAIGFPYIAADPRRRGSSFKERTWPTESQLVNPPSIPRARPHGWDRERPGQQSGRLHRARISKLTGVDESDFSRS